MLNIKIILGSTRDGRFGENVLNWVKDQLKSNRAISFEFIDLKKLDLNFFEEANSPKQKISSDPKVQEWSKIVSSADGFIIISPEYNHGYPAALKNAIDYLYSDWNNKPIAFVSYGNAGGARAIEQLRLVAIELQMAPIREAIHFLKHWEVFSKKGLIKKDFSLEYQQKFQTMLSQLTFWADALKYARYKKQTENNAQKIQQFVAKA